MIPEIVLVRDRWQLRGALSRRDVLVTGGALVAASGLQASPVTPVQAQELTPTQPKPATEATKAANHARRQDLNFGDKQDFEDATRGLIANRTC